VRNLVKTYQGKSGPVHAVKGISFTVKRRAERRPCRRKRLRQVHDLVDPRAPARPDLGRDPLRRRGPREDPGARFARDPRRAAIQMVFQDATDSLNPRHPPRQTIAEPLRRLARLPARLHARIEELADARRPAAASARPLSASALRRAEGARRHRARHRARAALPDPRRADRGARRLDPGGGAEPAGRSARRLGMSYLFVSHDLHVVRLLCDHVIVMKDGEIVEQGPPAQVMAAPAHPYTRSCSPRRPSRRFGAQALAANIRRRLRC
jgi:peptide/nickel transport system ATP-binding protein